MPTRCNRWYLLQILLLAQHVSGTIMPIIRSSRVLYRRSLPGPHHTDNFKTKAPNTTGSDHLYNTLELLMMGIMVPETCWASNKIYNKYHLLHLVGVLFPRIFVFFVSHLCIYWDNTSIRQWLLTSLLFLLLDSSIILPLSLHSLTDTAVAETNKQKKCKFSISKRFEHTGWGSLHTTCNCQ